MTVEALSSPQSAPVHGPAWGEGLGLQFSRLDRDLNVDVVVIGGGIAGLSSAYTLAGDGQTVVLLDENRLGGGQTGLTSAHLASALDDRFTELERLHGPRGAALAAQSHAAAIDWIEARVHEHQIDCRFRRVDGLLYPAEEAEPGTLAPERDAARRAGLSVDWTADGRALQFQHQAQFHPLLYLRGLAEACRARGVRIYEQTRVTELESGAISVVHTRQGRRVYAHAVVVATNSPINSRYQMPLKQSAWRTYMVGLRVRRGRIAPALYWDNDDPYHYARLQEGEEPDEDILIVGGEDHKVGQAADMPLRYRRLEAWTRRFFGLGDESPLAWQWSGQIMEPSDALAYIGRLPGSGPRTFIVTGDSGNGLTHGTIAGLMMPALLGNREHPWAPLYSPGRWPWRAASELLRENANAIGCYADWLKPGDKKSRRCPHLGAIVRWNPDEQSWDCPAHGSRFSAAGARLNPPSNQDLTLKSERNASAFRGA